MYLQAKIIRENIFNNVNSATLLALGKFRTRLHSWSYVDSISTKIGHIFVKGI